MKLNKETRAILKKELEWLPELLPEVVRDFKVQIFDLEALSLRPLGVGLSGFHVYLIDVSGKVIGEVGRKRLYYRNSWPTRKILEFFLSPEKADGYYYDSVFVENIEEAVERLKPDSWRTQFVLHIDGYHSTLYKMPRGRSLDVQLEVKRQEMQKDLIKFLQEN